METQEAYEGIKRYFSKPGARLAQRHMNGGGTSCDYLAPDGAKCAVGCLIPKSMYDAAIEGAGVDEALGILCDLHPKEYEVTFGHVSIAFLSEAQEAHDCSNSVSEFLAKLEQLATDWGFETTGGAA